MYGAARRVQVDQEHRSPFLASRSRQNEIETRGDCKIAREWRVHDLPNALSEETVSGGDRTGFVQREHSVRLGASDPTHGVAEVGRRQVIVEFVDEDRATGMKQLESIQRKRVSRDRWSRQGHRIERIRRLRELIAVSEAVSVGIEFERVRRRNVHLIAVREAVSVRIGRGRIGAEGILGGVDQAVIVQVEVIEEGAAGTPRPPRDTGRTPGSDQGNVVG